MESCFCELSIVLIITTLAKKIETAENRDDNRTLFDV